ncbi:MAG: ADP-ribosyltransferase [Sphingosinicella sp.]
MALSDDEIAAVRAYAGLQYRMIDGCLRGDKPCPDAVLEQIRLLDSAVAKSQLKSDVVLFRGVDGDAADSIRAGGTAIGSILCDPAFMSTTTNPEKAALFSTFPPGGIMYKISALKGMSALPMASYSNYPKEQEFLLPRGTKLKVLGYNAANSELLMEVVIDD